MYEVDTTQARANERTCKRRFRETATRVTPRQTPARHTRGHTYERSPTLLLKKELSDLNRVERGALEQLVAWLGLGLGLGLGSGSG